MSDRRCRLEVDAVLSDMDGVLLDSTSIVERLWREFAARHGLVVDEVLQDLHGRRMGDLVAHHLPHRPASEVEAEVARVEQAEVDAATEVRALPGALALAAALSGRSWAIVTSGNRRAAEARARAVGLQPPPVFITAEDVARGKPAPDPYLEAARRLGVDSARTVVFEDAPAGISAANAAGCSSVALLTSHRPAALAAADHLVTDLGSSVELVVPAATDGPMEVLLACRRHGAA